ncbi:protein unc-93 homolog A [Exaiptasia diaphana]|uniref:Protein unc-93 homolog A n=1 Tax=Exaiptasia diaphana TaxID=2652724 RepID=A0A913WXR4_EXADI|nr:protein unc-93 homolog A [Exaiptasia diaphana]KXJ17014.1 Protein unc-93-like A [Exaiptasia diaphana]
MEKQNGHTSNGTLKTFIDKRSADLEDVNTMSPEQKRKEKIYITKNVVIISGGFLFLFTAFQSLQNLQSSLNADKGLGLISLCVIYASLILSCMFVPPYMIGRLGCKWALVVSMISYVLYTVANYYVKYWTLIPASILVGLSAAPLWSSKCAYLTTSAIRYTELSKETQEAVVTRFFGIFFLIFQSGQIWGNLISSMVLQQGEGEDVFRSDAGEVCGARYCKPPATLYINGTNSTGAPSFTPKRPFVITMLSIYFGIGAFAVIFIIICLNKLTGKMSRKKDQETGLSLLIATVQHVRRDYKMKLIVPLTFYSGLEQAFIFGDFTAAFVTCSLGVHRVGFVMICFGVTDAAFSFILGKLTQYTGRLPVFVSGLLVHLTAIITMLLWRPDPSLVWVFYVLAALQGFCDAIWQTQINALYGCYFPDNQEAAFSNYRLWESLGFVVAFAYGNFLCINVKLYILLGVLILGMVGYFVAELTHYRAEKNSFSVSQTANDTELAQTNKAMHSEENLNNVA